MKDYNVLINGRNFFNQPEKNNLTTYDNIRKIATGQEDGYTTGRLLDYNYFNNYFKMIATDLSKQHALNADPKSNTANQFYCKSKSKWKHSNIFHY